MCTAHQEIFKNIPESRLKTVIFAEFFENLGWYLRDFIQLDLHSDIHHFSCWEQEFLLSVIS